MDESGKRTRGDSEEYDEPANDDDIDDLSSLMGKSLLKDDLEPQHIIRAVGARNIIYTIGNNKPKQGATEFIKICSKCKNKKTRSGENQGMWVSKNKLLEAGYSEEHIAKIIENTERDDKMTDQLKVDRGLAATEAIQADTADYKSTKLAEKKRAKIKKQESEDDEFSDMFGALNFEEKGAAERGGSVKKTRMKHRRKSRRNITRRVNKSRRSRKMRFAVRSRRSLTKKRW